MDLNIEFHVGADRQRGEPRLWLYADREQWPSVFRGRLDGGPQPVVVHVGGRVVDAQIKAHDGDGSRTYVAAGGPATSWPGHRAMTEHLQGLQLSPGDPLRCLVVAPD